MGGALAGRIVALPQQLPPRRSRRASSRWQREGDPPPHIGAQSTTRGPRSPFPLLLPRPGPSGRWRKSAPPPHPSHPTATTATVTKWQPGARQSCHRRAGPWRPPLAPSNASAPFGEFPLPAGYLPPQLSLSLPISLLLLCQSWPLTIAAAYQALTTCLCRESFRCTDGSALGEPL